MKKFREYAEFARSMRFFLKGQHRFLLIFIVLAAIGAGVEGIGISLLIPVLESMGERPLFSGVPLLSYVSEAFDGLEVQEKIKYAATAMLGVVLLRGALKYATAVLGAILPINIRRGITLRTFSGLLNVGLHYINQSSQGEISNLVRGHPNRVSAIAKGIADLIWNFFVFLVYFVFVATISFSMTGVSLIFMLFVLLFIRKASSRWLQAVGAAISDTAKKLNQVFLEALQGMKAVRLASAETYTFKKFREATIENESALKRKAYLTEAIGPIISTGVGILICAILFFISTQLTDTTEINQAVGQMLLFILVVHRMLTPITSIGGIHANIKINLHALQELETFFGDMEKHRQPNGATKLDGWNGDIRFENVSFSYGGADEQVIKNVSFSIPKGSMVAVAGPSGAGKTTLVALLTRLFDPDEGRITVDGADLRDLDVHDWRRHLRVVSQDIFIINDTIENNIRFGTDDVSREMVMEAARFAAADEFIARMPEGYDTFVGDRGVRLSGGQQQRIAIARAVLTHPQLLILDEATSHLDSLTERAVQRAIETLDEERTMFVIAHRLSTILRADTILVMDDGHLVEQGRHEELLRSRGPYWEMFEHQRLDLVDESKDET